MKTTRYTSDHIVTRFDLGFDFDTVEVEDSIQREQHRLTSDGFSIIQTTRRGEIEGTTVTIEAVRFISKVAVDG